MANGNEQIVAMDFSWRAIARVCIEQWQTNPLCRRLWRLIRPYVLAFALIQVISGLSGVALSLISRGGKFASTSAVAVVGLGVAASAFGLVIFALMIMAPLLYAKWAYHKSFLDDDMLRLANLSFRDRLMGILVPGVVAIGVVWALVFVVGVIQTVLVFGGLSSFRSGIPFITSPRSVALLGIATALNHVVFAIGYSLVFASVVLRRLIQARWGGAASGRGAFYVAIPYLIGVGTAFAASLLSSVPMMLIMFIGVVPAMGKSAAKAGAGAMRTFPVWASSLLVVSFSVRVLIAAGMVLLLRALLASLWRDDILAAKAWLFDASSFGDMTLVAPPGQWAPSSLPAVQAAGPGIAPAQPVVSPEPVSGAHQEDGAGSSSWSPANLSGEQQASPSQPSASLSAAPVLPAPDATTTPPPPSNFPPVPLVHVCYPDGTWYGPYLIADVVTWSRQGRIPPNVWIRDVSPNAKARPLSDDLADFPTGPPTLGERLIPKNKAAVLSYYLGLASFVGLVMCVIPGVILSIIAIIQGVKGLQRAQEKPHLRGQAHAITGIVSALISLFIGAVVALRFL